MLPLQQVVSIIVTKKDTETIKNVCSITYDTNLYHSQGKFSRQQLMIAF